jgi:hypothetical protein
MAKKKAIIHIGGHKTGTSAIQAFCVLNSTNLQHVDILYPMELVTYPERTGGQAHHCLVNLFMDATTFWKSVNLRPKGMADDDIVNSLKALPRDKNILLSSENLVWLDKQSIHNLNELLTGFDVYVVLYARRQDDALQALYQTVVASIGESKTFADYTSEGVRILFDYCKIAENWQSVFGDRKVIVRVYEKSQLYQGDSVADFFHVLEEILQSEIDLSNWEHSTGTVNRGLPAHITSVIQKLNNYGFFSKKLIIPAIKILTRYLYTDSRGSYEIILPSERKALLESYTESNENLAKKFLGRKDGVLFKNLSIKQTDSEWHEKYNQAGSHFKLLLHGILLRLKPKKSQ